MRLATLFTNNNVSLSKTLFLILHRFYEILKMHLRNQQFIKCQNEWSEKINKKFQLHIHESFVDYFETETGNVAVMNICVNMYVSR